MSDGKPAPAGWHPDPDAPGMVRYWDGQRWTDMSMPEALVPQPASTTDKVVAIMGGAAKMWFLLLLLAFFLLLLWIAL